MGCAADEVAVAVHPVEVAPPVAPSSPPALAETHPPHGWAPAVIDRREVRSHDEWMGQETLERTPHQVCEVDVEHRSACDWASGPLRVRWSVLPAPGEGRWADDGRGYAIPEFSMGGGPWAVPDGWTKTRDVRAQAYVDVPRRGCRTLQLLDHSGGSHCCDTSYLLTDCPDGANATAVFLPDAFGELSAYATDFAQDGGVEWAVEDWSFHDFEPSWAHSCMPFARVGFRRLLAWSPSGWHVAPRTRPLRAYHVRAKRRALRIRAEHPTESWEVSHTGAERALLVSIHSHMAGEALRGVIRDAYRGLAERRLHPSLLIDAQDRPITDPDAIRTWNGTAGGQYNCVQDAPELARVVVDTLERFGPDHIKVLWHSPGTHGARRK